MHKKLIGGLSALIFLLSSAPAATAQPLFQAQIGNGSPSSCTEAALSQALQSPGTVTFNCGSNPVTIPITTQITVPTGNHTLDGGGKIILDAGGRSRILLIKSSSNSNYSNVTINNITLRGGRATYAGDASYNQDANKHASGGAIFVETWGNISLNNVTFDSNHADATFACMGGGAIFLNGFGTASITSSTFIGNTAYNGGAINNITYDLSISNTLFERNVATHPGGDTSNCGGGGAIFIDGASDPAKHPGATRSISISSSLFRSNTTNALGGAIVSTLYSIDNMYVDRSAFESNQGGSGGALYLQGQPGSDRPFNGKYFINNSTFNSNVAGGTGGGMWLWNAPTELTNVTLTGNTATASSGGAIAIENFNQNPFGKNNGDGVVLKHVTVANNAAAVGGGGVSPHGNTATMKAQIANSIISNNTVAGKAQNCGATFINRGGNIQWPGSGQTNCGADIFQDPRLAGLADNGGPKLTLEGSPLRTMALQSGSPAINHGVTTYCTGADERGFTRTAGCDSGAFEFNAVQLKPTGFLPYIRR